MSDALKARGPAALACALAIAAGLASRYGLHGFWSKYLGVAFWATEVYAVVVLVRPTVPIRRAAAVALAVSWAVELAQATPVPAWLSSQHILLRLIFGIGFSPFDLPWYAVGVAFGAGLHAAASRMHSRREQAKKARSAQGRSQQAVH